jgi:hypothetical protein
VKSAAEAGFLMDIELAQAAFSLIFPPQFQKNLPLLHENPHSHLKNRNTPLLQKGKALLLNPLPCPAKRQKSGSPLFCFKIVCTGRGPVHSTVYSAS